MLLDDALQHGWFARVVPDAVRIDDGDRAALTDLQAVDLGAKDPAGADELELAQTGLEVLPRREADRLLATFGFALIAAEKDVVADSADPEFCCDLRERTWHRASVPEACSGRTHVILDRARPSAKRMRDIDAALAAGTLAAAVRSLTEGHPDRIAVRTSGDELAPTWRASLIGQARNRLCDSRTGAERVDRLPELGRDALPDGASVVARTRHRRHDRAVGGLVEHQELADRTLGALDAAYLEGLIEAG